jgi:hypothetical protein
MADRGRSDSDKSRRTSRSTKGPDSNPDPITGAPGAHPVGTGVGAAAGGAAAAAAGAAIGAAISGPAAPIGGAVGAVVGAVAGGLAGKGVAEQVNPTVEDEYWRTTYSTRPYYEQGVTYDEYRPAYQYGWEYRAKPQYRGKTFDEIEPEMQRDWDAHRGQSKLSWAKARNAARDAWHRVERAVPGDFDKDGR